MFKKIKTSDFLDIIAFSSFISFIICFIVIDSFNGNMEGIWNIIKNVRDISLVTSIFVLISYGIYSTRNSSKKRKPIIRLIAGILLFSAVLSFLILMNYWFHEVAGMIKDESVIKKLETILTSDTISSTTKAKVSEVLAQEKYFKKGIITDCIDSLGTIYKYSPTVEVINQRNIFYKNSSEFLRLMPVWENSILILSVIVVLSIILGFALPKSKGIKENKIEI